MHNNNIRTLSTQKPDGTKSGFCLFGVFSEAEIDKVAAVEPQRFEK